MNPTMKVARTARTYRIPLEVDAEIKRVATKMNISESDVIAQAVMPPKFNRVLTEGKEIRGGVGRIPTTPKPKIVMIAQQPARQPMFKPNGKIS